MKVSKELRLKKYHQKLLDAGIFELWWDKEIEDFLGDENAKNKVTKYISTLVKHSKGIFFLGNNGTGKTYLMNCIMKEGIKKNFKVKVVSLNGILEKFTAGWYDEKEKANFQKDILEVDLLGIDDIGKEIRNKSGLSEMVFDNMIRYRVQRKKTTILTSNMLPKEIREVYGDSLASLFNEFVELIKVDGEDFRFKKRGV